MEKYIKELDLRTKELEELKIDPDFKDKVFKLDGSPNSPYLKLYTTIINKFFNIKNTEEIKNLNIVKQTTRNKLKQKNISKKEYEKSLKEYKEIEHYDKWILNIILFGEKKHKFLIEEKEIKEKEFEELFGEHEDKFLLETLLKEKEYELQEFIEYVYKIQDLIEFYSETEKKFVFDLLSLNVSIKKEENFREYIIYKNMLERFFIGEKVEPYVKEFKKRNILTEEYYIELKEEDKKNLTNILEYKYNMSKSEKELIEKELNYIILAEYIYINKFDKLIKKTIHNKTQNRYISSSVSGTISSSSTEQMQPTKYQKDDLIALLKKEALSYALEGFLIGMRKYDISMGNQLSTYITWWLEQRVVKYIESDSSLNKATKRIDNLKNYNFEDAEEENFHFHKFDNIKYDNYNFQDIDDMTNSMVKNEEDFFSFEQNDLVYDILKFFCKHKDIFMYHEYLLIKYDLLLENFIYFIDINPKKDIKDCFYKDINIFIEKIKKEPGYENVKEFTEITEFYKISELLEKYFNIEQSEFLSVKRSLKQKFINMLNKIFTKTDEE